MMLLMLPLTVIGFHFICVYSKKCATFQVSDLPNLQLVGKENMSMTFTFSLEHFHCNSWDNMIILVSKYEKRQKYFQHKCRIHRTNATCISTTSSLCTCLSPNKYMFTKTLHRTDNTEWKLSTDDGNADERLIYFNITYPAIVNSLTISGLHSLNYAKVNTSVSVACSWENGNPPTALRLLDMHGNIIRTSSTSGIVTHQFFVSSCYDNGVILCEANGSSRNRSSQLVVECPPEYRNDTRYINTMVGESVSFSFPVRSFTAIILQCHLVQYSAETDTFTANPNGVTNRTYSCRVIPPHDATILNASASTESRPTNTFHEQKCQCILHGIDPDSFLTVNFNNITGLDFGIWQVLVRSSVGSVATTVCIQQYEDPPNLGPSHADIVEVNIDQTLTIGFPISPQNTYIRQCSLTKLNYTDLHGVKEYTGTFSYSTHHCIIKTVVPHFTTCSAPSATSDTASESPDLRTSKCSCDVTVAQTNTILNLTFCNVGIHDGGRWRLTVSNKNGSDYEDINIQVSSASPRINELTLNGFTGHTPYTVSRNQSVLINCSWDNGFPPTTVRLLDTHAKLLASSSTAKTIRHQLSSVSCHHMGIVRCEAYGSLRNKTATLLVRCPPKFSSSDQQNVSALVGHNVEVASHLTSYTVDITECRIIKHRKHNNTKYDHDSALSSTTHNCVVRSFSPELLRIFLSDSGHVEDHEKCACVLNGTVPSLILTLHVFHVNLYEGGRWKLTVANEEGQDSLIMALRIEDSTEITEQKWIFVLAVVVPLSFLVVVVIGVALYRACKQKIEKNSEFVSGLGSVSPKCNRFQEQPPQNDPINKDLGTKLSTPSYQNGELMTKMSDKTFQSPRLHHIPKRVPDNYETVVKRHREDTEPVISKYEGERDGQLRDQFTISFVKSATEELLRAHESVHSAYLTPCSLIDSNQLFMPTENHFENTDYESNSSSSKYVSLMEHHRLYNQNLESKAPLLREKSSVTECPHHYDLCVKPSSTHQHSPLTSHQNEHLNNDYQSVYESID